MKMKKNKLIITTMTCLLVVLPYLSSDFVANAKDIPDAKLINVEIREIDSENTTVIITTDVPVEYRYFKLDKPPVLAIDLLKTIHALPKNNLSVAKGMVTGIRTAQNRVKPAKVTRVALDLISGNTPYKVTKSKNHIIIETGRGAGKPGKGGEKRVEAEVPATPQPEGITAGSQTMDYRLGPDDVLKIIVYREEELDRKVRVSSDGYISLPLLGKVRAEGFTVSELESSITKKFKRYLKKPHVTAFISEYSTITVTGQVKKPGSFPLKGELSVIEAIGLAGGFTKYASRNNVKIMRIKNRRQKTILVKVEDINKEGDKSKDVSLQRGDIVFVPEQYSTITVTGQVRKPGSYPLKGELSVIEAIGLAGGFTKYASRNNVKIMRMDNDRKKPIKIKVRVGDISKEGDKSKDVSLQRGDIVFVPESLF